MAQSVDGRACDCTVGVVSGQGKRIMIGDQFMTDLKAGVGANLRVRPVGRHIGLPLQPRL